MSLEVFRCDRYEQLIPVGHGERVVLPDIFYGLRVPLQFNHSLDELLYFDIVAANRGVDFLRCPVDIDIRLISLVVIELRQDGFRLLRCHAAVKIFPHVPVQILLLEFHPAADIEREDSEELQIILLILLADLRIPPLHLRQNRGRKAVPVTKRLPVLFRQLLQLVRAEILRHDVNDVGRQYIHPDIAVSRFIDPCQRVDQLELLAVPLEILVLKVIAHDLVHGRVMIVQTDPAQNLHHVQGQHLLIRVLLPDQRDHLLEHPQVDLILQKLPDVLLPAPRVVKVQVDQLHLSCHVIPIRPLRSIRPFVIRPLRSIRPFGALDLGRPTI